MTTYGITDHFDKVAEMQELLQRVVLNAREDVSLQGLIQTLNDIEDSKAFRAQYVPQTRVVESAPAPAAIPVQIPPEHVPPGTVVPMLRETVSSSRYSYRADTSGSSVTFKAQDIPWTQYRIYGVMWSGGEPGVNYQFDDFKVCGGANLFTTETTGVGGAGWHLGLRFSPMVRALASVSGEIKAPEGKEVPETFRMWAIGTFLEDDVFGGEAEELKRKMEAANNARNTHCSDWGNFRTYFK